MSFISVVNKVLSKVKPSPAERDRLSNIVRRVSSLIKDSLLNNGISAEVVPGGSFARGTFLHGAHDVDFFIRHKDPADLESFPRVVLDAFPEAVRVEGSRTYFRASHGDYELEFVPTLLIDDPSDALNSMDASFFHISYVNSRLDNALRDQVLLFKQFAKACGVYGAESHISGFSGYVIELLMLRFKRFKRFLEFLDQGNNELFLDLEGFYDSVSKAYTALKVNRSLTPVVVVDPVLPTRNAAAALSRESFDKFLLQARLFLRGPSESFFTVKEPLISDLTSLARDRGHPFFTYSFKVSGKRDVFFAKLARSLRLVKARLERHGFVVYDHGFLSDGTVYFELVRDVLPLTKRVIGPPVSIDSAHFNAFISRDAVNGPYVFNGRVCFDVAREHTRAKPLLLKLLKGIEF
ncbi:hypothetical protein GF352_00770 [archaeon]|nr:hypothetical protein [archaeon]